MAAALPRAALRRLSASWQAGRPLLGPGSARGTDLSRVGGSISGDFGVDVAPEAWESFALTDPQVQQFREKGFLSSIPLLSDEECDALAAEVDDLLVDGHPGKELWYGAHLPLVASGAWRISQPFHDLLWSPRFRMAAYQLLGGPCRFLHDQIFCKPAAARCPQSWFGFHQDLYYWSWTTPMAHLTCWVALDDATEDNGCLQYVPGSHRWGLLPDIPADAEPAIDAVNKVLSPEQRQAVANAERVPLRKGMASFHHPLTLHGSGSNATTRPRRAVALNTILDGTRSNYELMPPPGKFPFIPQGQPLGRSGHQNDRFYPLLLGDPARQPGCAAEAAGPGAEVLAQVPRSPRTSL